MFKILFVCLGNICRSPMAEFVFKSMAEKAGVSRKFCIESAGTCDIEVGKPVYPPAKEVMEANGIDCSLKRARQVKKEDYDLFDIIVGMDEKNIEDMRELFGKDDKLHLLMDYAGKHQNVADPFFTRDFLLTWKDVNEGCEALLKSLC